MRTRLRSGLILLVLLAPAGAAAEAGAPLFSTSLARLDLRADLQNIFQYRNDADFDRTAPFYDEDGQSVGAFATIFRPRLQLQILQRLQIVYELEIGLNYWSRNSPDQDSPTAGDIFLMKHREIYAAGELLGGRLGFRAGYSYFREPTGLFVAHWIGNAQLWGAFTPRLRAGLFVGQVPDQTREGIPVTENNFRRDIWVAGINLDLRLASWLGLQGAVTTLIDAHLVGQTRTVACPSLRLEAASGRWTGYLDAALQAGLLQGHRLDGGDQTQLAWALQGGAVWQGPRLRLAANLLLLSPDDGYDGNGRSSAFLYSGKSASATRLLTEDELRDWYDNLDERMATFSGGFFENRAGLLVADLSASFLVHRFFRPGLVLGLGSVLEARNALDAYLVGVEADLILDFPISAHLLAQISGSLLVPGAAGAALINRIERTFTDLQLQAQASLLVRY